MRARWLVAAWVVAAVGACGGSTNDPAGISEGIAGDGSAGAPGSGDVGGSAGECVGTLCGTDCVDLDTDVEHCGECGAACTIDSVPNTAAVACLDGSCIVAACTAGFSDCDADPANGCEVAVDDDPANCGACAADCAAVANASESSCVAGVCEIVSCDAGFGDCNAVHADGCEVNLDSDPENCSLCDAVCSDGVCVEGHCQ